MYSIVKAQQNLHNDMCALLGLMRDFAVGWAYRGGRDESWGYDEFGRLVGLGCRIGIGSRSGLGGWGVSGVERESCGYTHTALLHLSPPNLHTPCLPHLPTTAYAPLATPHSHHLAQTPIRHTLHTYKASILSNSTPAPTLLQPTRPDPRPYPQPSVHYPTRDTPYPLQTRPTPSPQPNPSTPPYTLHILSYPQSPHPSYPYMLIPPQRRISPSKAHMSLFNRNMKR